MWNTIAAEQASALKKALFTLEVLSSPESEPLLDFLLEHREATVLDLLIATGLDNDSLEEHLDLLCKTEVVQLNSNLYKNYYQVDNQKLRKVKSLAKQLVNQK